MLGICSTTVWRAIKQLKEVGLIEEKRQGLNRPNLIYIGKIDYSVLEEKEPESIEKEIMTVREFAKHTGLSECCVRKLLREEKVFYMKIGSRYYINAPRTIDFLTHNPIMDITWKEPVASV